MNRKKLEFVHVELKRDTWINPRLKVSDIGDAVAAAGQLIAEMDREMMIQLNISTPGNVINASVVSIGNINTSFAGPPEIFRTAILSGASRLILIHNHPGGSMEPSDEDRQVANKLAFGADMLGLQLLDFIVIGENGYYSMLEKDHECLDVDAMAAEF